MRISYFYNVVLRQAPFFYNIFKKRHAKHQYRIIGIIRERNESLILQDTLDHIAQFVDGVVVFDDASTDNSVKIAMAHPSVIEVIANKKWRGRHRVWEETANRKKLHDRAKKYGPEWLFYFDADERFEGDVKEFLENCPPNINAIKISLLDAYITDDDKRPYAKGDKLYNFRRYFGPEKRDILMIWRNCGKADFTRPDAREPQGFSNKEKLTKFYCQHYGKALSVEHWEETCRYYVDFFPKYSKKWQSRIGKAVHTRSDFGNKLYTWSHAKKRAFVRKTPPA